jgi:hypothetical protein
MVKFDEELQQSAIAQKPPSRTESYYPEVVKMLHTLAAEEPITPPQDTEEFLAWLKQRY